MKVFILRWNPEISSFKKKSYNRILKMLKKETCLSAKELEPLFPEIDWHGGHSGIVLDTKTGKNLIADIDKSLEETKKTPETNFSTFLKNDNRFLPIDFLNKKAEILKILEPYNHKHFVIS